MSSMDNVHCRHLATDIVTQNDTLEGDASRHDIPDPDANVTDHEHEKMSQEQAQIEVKESIEPIECTIQESQNLESGFIATSNHGSFSSAGRDRSPDPLSQQPGIRPVFDFNFLSISSLARTSVTPGDTIIPQSETFMRSQNQGFSASGSLSIYQNSPKTFFGSTVSCNATGAMVSDHSQQSHPTLPKTSSGISSMELEATMGSDNDLGEWGSCPRSYAHELVLHKDGHVLGGTLRALVEHLTGRNPPPDRTFVTTFYMTFRVFTNATELVHTLMRHCRIVETISTQNMQTLIQVYNFFEGWLKFHWLSEHDMPAMKLICTFATGQLQELFPGLGKRLMGLAKEVSQRRILNKSNQLVSSIRKSSGSQDEGHSNKFAPNAVDGRKRFRIFRVASVNISQRSILKLKPLEVAHQLSITQSRNFCAIQAEEFLNLEWAKNPQRAINVRAMICFATGLSDFIANTILSFKNVKRRAAVIQQWIETGSSCLELSNYDCLMAIVCSLTSSPILRLEATWEQVSQRKKRRFRELEDAVSVSHNYAALRKRMQASKAPSLPFIGIYLTDLTFIDAGNQDTRILSDKMNPLHPVEAINFDKHRRTANIITQLQRHQMPYQFQPGLEVQKWIEIQMAHNIRTSKECCELDLWDWSIKIEPKTGRKEQRLGNRPLAALRFILSRF